MGTELRGQIVGGRYRILSQLGEGGMGRVLRAEQLDAAGQPLREVALKMLLPEISKDPDFSQRFLREVRIAAKLRSPHTVTVYESGQTDDKQLYFSMELIDGDPLDTVLRGIPQLPIERVARIASQVCDALGEAHSLPEPIVHRDLKPENIFLETRRGMDYAKVGDFGIAKVVGDRVSRLTHAGVTPGTPCYMAPEQWKGKDVDGRTDLYALGIAMYEMITGRPPFASDEGPLGFMYQHLEAEPPPLPDSVPAEIARLIEQLLAKDPGDRPADAYEVRAVLEEILHGFGERERQARAAKSPPQQPVEPSPPGGSPQPVAAPAPAIAPRAEAPTVRDPPKPQPAPAATPATATPSTPPAASRERPKTPVPLEPDPTPRKTQHTPSRNKTRHPTAATNGGHRGILSALGILALILAVGVLLLVPQFGDSIFIWAAKDNIRPLLHLGLAAGLDPNARGPDGRTVLMDVARNGEAEIAGAMLKRTRAIDSKDASGFTALAWAVQSGSFETVHAFLRRGAELNAQNNRGQTPLALAVMKGEYEIVQLLVREGARVDTADGEGRSPLTEAAANGDERIVDFLLAAGADPKRRDHKGRTPADHASDKGHTAIAAKLR